jgi:hypothetical protein
MRAAVAAEAAAAAAALDFVVLMLLFLADTVGKDEAAHTGGRGGGDAVNDEDSAPKPRGVCDGGADTDADATTPDGKDSETDKGNALAAPSVGTAGAASRKWCELVVSAAAADAENGMGAGMGSDTTGEVSAVGPPLELAVCGGGGTGDASNADTIRVASAPRALSEAGESTDGDDATATACRCACVAEDDGDDELSTIRALLGAAAATVAFAVTVAEFSADDSDCLPCGNCSAVFMSVAILRCAIANLEYPRDSESEASGMPRAVSTPPPTWDSEDAICALPAFSTCLTMRIRESLGVLKSEKNGQTYSV